MENTPRRIHPLIAVAAVSVTIASLVAVAAITGILPGSHAEPTPATPSAPQAAATEPATPAAAPEPAAATAEHEAVTVKEKPAVHKPVPKSHIASRPAATTPVKTAAVTPPPPPPPVCTNCGTIESIREVVQKPQGSGLGAVAGGILGGVLGHQVGSGRGNDLATVVGAVGGAVAGNEVEKSRNKTVHYEISVLLDNGSREMITTKEAPAWREGERVRIVDGALAAAN